MSDFDCRDVRELLDAYTDGELMVETSYRLLRHVRSCVSCGTELSARETIRHALGRLDGPSQAPPQLRTAIRQRMNPQPRSRMALAAASCLLTFGLLVGWQLLREEPLNAAVLLEQATAREEEAGSLDEIVRRVLLVEERQLPAGTLVRLQRVEVWTDRAGRRIARRAYNQDALLLAGEWREGDQGRVYRRNVASVPSSLASLPLAGVRRGESWRLDLSAAAVAALRPTAGSGRVVRDRGTLMLEFEWPIVGAGVSRAQLFLRPHDLHAIEQRLTVHGASGVLEIRVREAEHVRLAARDVAERIFSPDPELVRAEPSPAASSVRREASTVRSKASPAPPPATLDNEIGLLHAVHRLHLLDDGRATVGRERSGRLVIRTSSPQVAGTLAALASGFSKDVVNPEIVVVAAEDSTRTAEATPWPLPEIDRRVRTLEDLFSRVTRGGGEPLSLDGEATWQSMVRDFAREIDRDSRTALSSLPWTPGEDQEPIHVVRVQSTVEAQAAVRRLKALVARARDLDANDLVGRAALLAAIGRQASEFATAWPLDLHEARR